MTLNLNSDIIKKYEGLEDGDPTTVNLDPYVCPAGIWTIGWGHAVYYNGKQLKADEAISHSIIKTLYPHGITKEEAEVLLVNDMNAVVHRLNRCVKVALNINQWSALVSFVFNIGIGNFKKSTLLKKLNTGDFNGAAEEFPKWRKANGKVLPGLVRRRAEERELFLS